MTAGSERRAAGYGIAVAGLVAAVALRWLLDPVMGDTLPLVTMFAAVAASVWSGGYRPAAAVAVLGYLSCAYLFIEPRGTFPLYEPHNQVGLVAYLVTCSIIVAFGEAARVSRRRFAELVHERDELFRPTSLTIESIRRK